MATKAPVHIHPQGGESLLHGMFNLICPVGHKSFSPEPMGFVGSQCMSSDKNGHRCHKRLSFLRDSRSIPEPQKPKSKKLKKMKRF